jgi:hypothetical protein
MAKPYLEDYPASDFDSKIVPPYVAEDRVRFEFTLILRLYLKQINPPRGKRGFKASDNDGTQWPALAWNGAAWRHFKDRFAELVPKVWDKAFVLIPPAKYDGFVWPEGGRRRNLLCRLRLKILDSPDRAHTTVQVVRLAAPGKSTFRSNSTLLATDDIIQKRHGFSPAGTTFLSNTSAHEVGHLLGMWDVGLGKPQCVDEHSPACYGTDLYERMNVMGAGSMLDLANARPWLRRVPFHATSTDKADWKADWASSEAALRGLDGVKVDEDHKVKPVKPGMIDL